MDDFIIPARTMEELEERTIRFLKIAEKHKFVFQKVKMRLQHGGNSYLRGSCWQRTDSNGTRKDQGSKRMEDTDKSERYGKLPGICKFLLTLYVMEHFRH